MIVIKHMLLFYFSMLEVGLTQTVYVSRFRNLDDDFSIELKLSVSA